MKPLEKNNWFEANQRFLMTALAEVRKIVENYSAQSKNNGKAVKTDDGGSRSLEKLAEGMSMPPTLETLCQVFGLSAFERNLLLMCAGMELDSSFASLFANTRETSCRPYPTFSLAMAVFPDAHWSALIPVGPLRHWRLLEIGNSDTLTTSPLRIDERILHYLCGVSHMDERLMPIVKPLFAPDQLVPSHQALAEKIEQVWSGEIHRLAPLPVIQLCGRDTASKQAIAAAACAGLDLDLYKISAHALPGTHAELDALIRLWEREALLEANALLIDGDEIGRTGKGNENLVYTFIREMRIFLFISSRDPHPVQQRPVITLHVGKPRAEEQQEVWHQALGTEAQQLNGHIHRLVSQFNLSIPVIQSVGAEVLAHPAAKELEQQTPGNGFGSVLWEACRVQSRPNLDELAQRIEPGADWDDLVLPQFQKYILREISLHVHQRARVYNTWGFAAKSSSRGLGISALFTGESGTGKTMAAEVLANELRLDLYHIDLSQVVSKYIGETEKNLRRIFDAAEDGGVILFFDEADALFGKRTQVKDSHDRYANIEVSYLLQRMEAYRGLAILTTNMKDALDKAFMRRIRFIVKFPFPNPGLRAEIWKRIFPADTPKGDLDIDRLAQLNITGGNIRNIALNAAFLAADADEPVDMQHLLRAVRSEYAKMEKTLNAFEIRGKQS